MISPARHSETRRRTPTVGDVVELQARAKVLTESAPAATLLLREYQRVVAHPNLGPSALLGRFLDDPELSGALQGSPLRGKLEVGENRHGLVLEASRWVGVVRLGSLQVRIEPKLPSGRLWPLVAYALGLDELHRRGRVGVQPSGDFPDLLAQAFLSEAERLWRGGLHRSYLERSEWLDSPRGRPEMAALARAQPLTRAALPCRHHAFTSDVAANRVVLAGLTLAGRAAHSSQLRSALHRAAQQWSLRCAPVPLTPTLLELADRSRDRLSERYSTAHHLVRLLAAGTGLDRKDGEVRIPGFLWDMASLFERFVSRFLAEHLLDHQVLPQAGIPHLYRLHRAPPGFRTPRPRPDLVVYREGRPLAVLDTKYADLVKHRPSSAILYQASVYALAWSGTAREDVPAILLFPNQGAESPSVEIHLDVTGSERPRRVLIRGVDWVRAGELVWQGGHLEERRRLAKQWAATTRADRVRS